MAWLRRRVSPMEGTRGKLVIVSCQNVPPSPTTPHSRSLNTHSRAKIHHAKHFCLNDAALEHHHKILSTSFELLDLLLVLTQLKDPLRQINHAIPLMYGANSSIYSMLHSEYIIVQALFYDQREIFDLCSCTHSQSFVCVS